jgi:hypothetical protein
MSPKSDSKTVSLTDLGNSIGQALGVKIDAASILEQVKANQAKLNSCELHDFVSRDVVPNLKTKYVCAKCAGEVDASRMTWYQKGLEHGRKAASR